MFLKIFGGLLAFFNFQDTSYSPDPLLPNYGVIASFFSGTEAL